MNTVNRHPDPNMAIKSLSDTGRWLRNIGIGFLTLAATAVSFLVSYAAVLQKRAPAQALMFWPSSGAKAGLAARLIVEPDKEGSRARAGRLARSALQVEPMSINAISTLAFLASEQGDAAQSARLFAYSERLSRRDLPTQLALIESKVQAGDVAGALVHYDRALRTSKAAESILMPVLVPAVADLDIARSLAPLLAARADWWKPFTFQMIQQGTPPPSSYVLLHALKLDIQRADERAMAVDAMQRMAGHGRTDIAARMYNELRGGQVTPFSRIRDGQFQSVDRLPPFDWEFTNAGDLSATVEPRPDGKGNGLFLVATNGASGRVARQLLLLSPGRYSLSFSTGLAAPSSRITASARCNSSETPSTSVRPSPADATQRIVMPFSVSPGCRGVWIEFDIQAGEGTETNVPWIAAVSVTPGRS